MVLTYAHLLNIRYLIQLSHGNYKCIIKIRIHRQQHKVFSYCVIVVEKAFFSKDKKNVKFIRLSH